MKFMGPNQRTKGAMASLSLGTLPGKNRAQNKSAMIYMLDMVIFHGHVSN